MKRLFYLLLTVLFSIPSMKAQNSISENEALEIAKSIFPKSKGGEEVDQKLSYVEKDSLTSKPYYYVFNRGNDEGFVIVCSDKRIKSIIGYSDTGSFDMNNVPEQMRGMLTFYKESLKELAVTPDSLLKMDYSQLTMSKARSKGSQTFASSVAPLLGGIKYNQGAPYNNYCPVMYNQRCVTGCVATAGAQVLRYHSYPRKGTGKSHSYVLNGYNYGVNYNETYDWQNMLPSYSGNESATNNNAVAQLMYHLGVSCDMGYTPSSSSAMTSVLTAGFVTYFGYDAGVVEYQKNYMKQSDWVYFLKRELNARRPVLMNGYGGGAGHAFVCDGYDANGLFHINWGWGGNSNGYFAINNLVPSSLGTGAGQGSYNENVSFFGGIQPPNGASKIVDIISIDGTSVSTSFARNQYFQFNAVTPKNIGLFHFSGKLGVAIYKDGRLLQVLSSRQIDLKPGYFFQRMDFTNLLIPSNIAAGKYAMLFVYKSDTDTQWKACLSKNGNCNYVDANITSSNVKLSFNYNTSIVSLDDSPIASAVIGNNTNNGADVTPGEDVVPGDDAQEVEKTAVLTLTKSMDIAGGENDEAVVTVTLKNQGNGDYSGKIGAFVYADTTWTQYLAVVKIQSATIPAGKTQTYKLSGVTELPDGSYGFTVLFTGDDEQWYQPTPSDYAGCTVTVTNPVAEEVINDNNTVPEGDNTLPGGDDNVNIDNGDVAPIGDGTTDETPENKTQPVIESGIRCQTFMLQDCENLGNSKFSASAGAVDVAEFKLSNPTSGDLSTVLYLSVFSAEGEWAGDLAEKKVFVKASSQKTVTVDVSFADLKAGNYTVILTEQSDGDIVGLTPDDISVIQLEIK